MRQNSRLDQHQHGQTICTTPRLVRALDPTTPDRNGSEISFLLETATNLKVAFASYRIFLLSSGLDSQFVGFALVCFLSHSSFAYLCGLFCLCPFVVGWLRRATLFFVPIGSLKNLTFFSVCMFVIIFLLFVCLIFPPFIWLCATYFCVIVSSPFP
jgi:hypothetical protein